MIVNPTTGEVLNQQTGKWGPAPAGSVVKGANGQYVEGGYGEGNNQWRKDFESTDKGDARLAAKGIFENVDPLSWFGGGKRSVGQQFLGSSIGNEDFMGNISWTDNPQDRDVYSQMDERQWKELSGLSAVGQRNWIKTRAQELASNTGAPRGQFVSHRNIGKPGLQGQADAAAGGAGGAGGMSGDGLDAKIKEFYDRMNAPLDMNDPEVKQAVATGTNLAQAQSARTGVQGGLSQAGITKAGLDSMNPIRQFRQGLGLQALGLANNREQGLRNLANQKYQMERENSLAGYKSKQANDQALWGTIGGVAGGVIGAYAGGPAGAAAGSQVGSGLLSGMSSQGNDYTAPPIEPYKGGAF